MVTTNIDEAKLFAYDKHMGQFYGDQPYTYHLDGVVDEAKRLFPIVFNDNYDHWERVCMVAWLHDTLEDAAYISFEELERKFGGSIANDVKLLTRKPDQYYVDYIEGLSLSRHALLVKLADLNFNIRHGKEEKRINKNRLEKYLLARYIVLDKLSLNDLYLGFNGITLP